VYELRFHVKSCPRRTSSLCSDDEVSSRLELLLAAGATIRAIYQAVHTIPQLPSHHRPYPRISKLLPRAGVDRAIDYLVNTQVYEV